MKIPVSSFLSYLWSYLAYRDVLYIKLKLLRFCFDLMLSFLAPGSIFVEQLCQEVVSFVFRVAQKFFVPNFYIALIWQLFFFFLWIFSSYAKELMHMISRKKKKLCIWYHFIKQNFQIHFVNVFFTHPLDLIRTQLFTKFGDPCCTQNGFPAKTILNFSRAWQAYLLSYYLQIW